MRQKTWACYSESDVDNMLKNFRVGDIALMETREAAEYYFWISSAQ